METKTKSQNRILMIVAGAVLVTAVIAAASTAIVRRQQTDTPLDEAADLSSRSGEASAPWFGRSASATLPAGTQIAMRLDETLTTASTQPGERFTARVLEPVVVAGRTVIPAGAVVSGVVRESARSKRIGGRARMSLELTSVTVGGVNRPLSADYTVLGKKQTGKDAATIGGATAGGAVLGRIIGHKRGDEAKGTAVGAVVGGAVGTGVAMSNRAPNVVLPKGATIQVSLDSPLTV